MADLLVVDTGLCVRILAGGYVGFDAITHAYATVATGGFSNHDASFAYFDSLTIEVIAMVFMLAGGVNFPCIFCLAPTIAPWVFQG